MFLHADNEDSDQTARRRRLIRVHWAHMSECTFLHVAAQMSSCSLRRLTVPVTEFYFQMKCVVSIVPKD